MPQPLYKPFIADNMRTLGNAYLKQQTNQLAQSAYMGDEQALAQLAGMNPQLAQSIKSSHRQTKMDDLAMADRERRIFREDTQDIAASDALSRERAKEAQTMKEAAMKKAASLGSFEAAKAYLIEQQKTLEDSGLVPRGQMQPLTEEGFKQIQKLYPVKVGTKVVDNKLVNDQTGEVLFSNVSTLNMDEVLVGASQDEIDAAQKASDAVGGGSKGITAGIAAANRVKEVKKDKLEADQKRRDLEFEGQNAIDGAEDSINTIRSMLYVDPNADILVDSPALEKAAGWQANFPTVSGTDASNFEAQLDTLQSQAFLTQVEKMKGMGALSENEGKKLAQAVGSLSIDMGDELLRKELIRIEKKLRYAQSKMREKYGMNKNYPVVSSKADFDNLPSGAIYMEDGERYRKP